MNGRLLLLLLSCLSCLVVAVAEGGAGRPSSWGDWVVAGDDADTGASILLRRITPKSVFVAPTFTGCSEGYRQDSLGRCVKLVKVNQQSQWNFFLERLNSMYSPSSTSKKPQKETGPFHISLPLASENPQEDSEVKKRLPPPQMVVEVKTTQPTLPPLSSSTTTTTTTTTTLLPTTSTLPTTTTMSESTTAEVPWSTTLGPSEVTSTEKETTSPETATETRSDTTTEGLDIAVMLGDQPYGEIADESFDTPKSKEKIPQLQEKPFLIIVTSPSVTRSETTPTFLPTEEDETSTVEATTEGNTKYTTEIIPPKTDESFGESRYATESSTRPTTIRPECEDQAAFEDCDPVETEVISGDASPSSLPELPLLDPSSQVRFPAESFVPVRKTQSFVRFPDVANPHEDRPAFWWPSWQIRQYPGIHGWPESSEQIHGSTDRVVQRKPQYATTWSGTMAWQRRLLQRD